MRRCSVVVALMSMLMHISATAADPAWDSRGGAYRVSFQSELQPIVINRIHRWTLIVTDREGTPVEGATITVDGGMPVHDHGLPTEPRVTRELAPGHYLLEGLRFHMAGNWQIVVTIESGDLRDAVVIDLEL